MKVFSVRAKIIILILSTVVLITTAVLIFTLRSNRRDLLDASRRNLAVNTKMIRNTIRSIMLAGNAPIAIKTIAELKRIRDLSAMELYRQDGLRAFYDYTTLKRVNRRADNVRFPQTPRVIPNRISFSEWTRRLIESREVTSRQQLMLKEAYTLKVDRQVYELRPDVKPKTVQAVYDLFRQVGFRYQMMNNTHFSKAVAQRSPVEVVLDGSEEMEYYFPILNYSECHRCHVDNQANFVRGVAYVRVSTAHVQRQIRRSIMVLSVIFLVSALVIGIVLLAFLNRIIVNPLLEMGHVIGQVEQGDFSVKTHLNTGDEMGVLGDQINSMIISIEERYRLSKYVSKSTEAMVKTGTKSSPVSKRATVIFTDIRGFTSFSENNSAERVVEVLNTILQAQAEVVERLGGDVDKFIGDAVMAVFEDPFQAVRAGYEMIREVVRVDKTKDTGLRIGVGINTGEVVAGNIGSQKRQEYALIGDTVNVASRLCSIAAKKMILISETTLKKVGDRVHATEVPKQTIKGKSKKVSFFVINSIEDPESHKLIK